MKFKVKSFFYISPKGYLLTDFIIRCDAPTCLTENLRNLDNLVRTDPTNCEDPWIACSCFLQLRVYALASIGQAMVRIGNDGFIRSVILGSSGADQTVEARTFGANRRAM